MPGSEEWSFPKQQFEAGLLDETGLFGVSPNASAFYPLSNRLQTQRAVLSQLQRCLHPFSPPQWSSKSRQQLTASIDRCRQG